MKIHRWRSNWRKFIENSSMKIAWKKFPWKFVDEDCIEESCMKIRWWRSNWRKLIEKSLMKGNFHENLLMNTAWKKAPWKFFEEKHMEDSSIEIHKKRVKSLCFQFDHNFEDSNLSLKVKRLNFLQRYPNLTRKNRIRKVYF